MSDDTILYTQRAAQYMESKAMKLIATEATDKQKANAVSFILNLPYTTGNKDKAEAYIESSGEVAAAILASLLSQ